MPRDTVQSSTFRIGDHVDLAAEPGTTGTIIDHGIDPDTYEVRWGDCSGSENVHDSHELVSA